VFNAVVDPGVLGQNNTNAINEILGFFTAAVANGEADTINLFPNATYKMTTTLDTNDGKNAFPSIVADGTGKNGITLNGNGATISRFSSEDFRFFRVAGAVNNTEFTINDLTLTGGSAGAGTDGGAVLVTGGAGLTVNNSTFSSNNAAGDGGAVAFSGTAGTTGGTFNNVLLSGNTAAGNGGGLFAEFGGFFQFNQTRFLSNTSIGGAGGVGAFSGAFEFNDATFTGNVGKGLGSAGAFSGSEAVFNRTTITNNTATQGGTGGVSSGLQNIRVNESYVAGNAGQFASGGGGGVQGARVEVFNSTVHNNSTGASGGGGVSGTDVTIRHSTVTNNSSTRTGGGHGVLAGSVLNLSHTIVANNTPDNTNGTPDILVTSSTASTSQGFNFIATLDSGNAKFNTVGTDQVGGAAADKRISPALGAPQANGGPVFTRALQAGSGAINAGSTTTGAFLTDARGFARRVGGRIDIGAFEVQNGTSVGIVSGDNQTTITNQPFANTLKVLVTSANGVPLASQLVRFEAPQVPDPTASAIFFGSGPVTGVITDSNGFAVASVSANAVAGDYVVTANTDTGFAPALFDLRNTSFGIAAPPTGTLQIVSGNNQTTTAAATYTQNLKVQVLDPGNFPIANVPVTFTAPTSGASITFTGGATTATVNTDAGGFVSIPVTANTSVGTFTVNAIGPNVGTVAFTLTNVPAAASKVTVVSGAGQSVLTDTAFNSPLRVLVTDFFGNPVLPGVSVRFAGPVAGAGATFPGSGPSTIVLTTAGGFAQASPTANGTGGAYFVDATVTGGSTFASFDLANIFVPPPPPPPPAPPNQAPIITDVLNQTIQNGQSGTFAFGVADAETPAANLNVTAASSNPAITPTVTVDGVGVNRTVTVVTAAGQTGTATITLTVTDASGASATDKFDVTLSPPPPPPPGGPVNNAPVVTDVVNQSLIAGQSGSYPFVVVDAETPADALTVTATAANTALLPAVSVTGVGTSRVVNVSAANGVAGITTVTLTVTDADGKSSTDTFDVNVSFIPPEPPPPPPPQRLVGTPEFAVGSGAGGPQAVRFFNANGTERFITAAFPGSPGGVRTATGDFNGDGVTDVVIGTGPGSVTGVAVLDGATGNELFRTQPFESQFTGGVYVAAGDLSGDGTPDLVITPDQGGGPRAIVLNGKGFNQITSFFVIDDVNFRGGARAAIGDVNGDGRSDLVASAGFRGGPRIAGYDGKSIGASPRKIFADFFLFEETLRNGAFVAVGDIDGDGFADVIGGGGPGGGPRILAYSGKSLLTNAYITRANFFAGDPNARGGVRVAVKNLDGDNKADIVVGAGDNAGNRATAYLGGNIAPDGTPVSTLNIDAFPGFAGGVFVG
jgi:hypothetical protein